MKITKRRLCDLPRCYATGLIEIDGETEIVLAPDDVGPCYQFSLRHPGATTVWDQPSGTMCIVPLPGRNGDFWAVQKFYASFRAEKSIVVQATRGGDGWDISTVLDLPYLHRFGILERGGVHYFLGCTLCTTKKEFQDWSDPGKLYVGEISWSSP